jgi:hypothetical protein
VQFTQSTLVSICHTATHVHQAHHRFQIFPDQKASSPSLPLSNELGFHVDLHTAQSPIIACGCTRLGELLSVEIGAQVATSVTLYAIKRNAQALEATSKRGTVSREWTYLFSQAWQPSVHQTTRGMAALLSSLYCMTKVIPSKVEGRVLSILHRVTYFPPAVRASQSLLIFMSYLFSHLCF